MNRDFSGATRDEAHLMQVINGIVYGDNPREGFFKDGRFYHPELAFSVAFPKGFQGSNTKQAVSAGSPNGDAAMQLTLGPNATPDAALARFLKESGVRVRSDPQKIGPAVAASFEADTDQGPLSGLIGYVEHRGKTFQLLGVATASSFAQYEDSFAKSLASFQDVQDPAVLDVRPNRLYVAKLATPEPVSALAKDRGNTLSAKDLAILNQADEGSALPKGGYAKWVAPEQKP
jgi:predicted Zn-dependent protease